MGKERPAQCPLASPGIDFEIPDIKITRDSGRIPLVLDVTRRIKKAVGDRTALYGLFCGPYTLASHLRGTNFSAMRASTPSMSRS